MFYVFIGFGITSLLLWTYFKKSNSRIPCIELPALDPRDVIDLNFFSCKNTVLASDESTGRPQSHSHPTSSLRKCRNKLSGFANSKPNVIGQEFYKVSFSPTSWEENDMWHWAKCLAGVLTPANFVLEWCYANQFMAQCSKCSVLKMH